MQVSRTKDEMHRLAIEYQNEMERIDKANTRSVKGTEGHQDLKAQKELRMIMDETFFNTSQF